MKYLHVKYFICDTGIYNHLLSYCDLPQYSDGVCLPLHGVVLFTQILVPDEITHLLEFLRDLPT